jgi:hypothetical protein
MLQSETNIRYTNSEFQKNATRRDAIYRVSNRCAFSGFWIKLDSRRDKSRLYGWLKHLANQVSFCMFYLSDAKETKAGSRGNLWDD